MSEEYDYSELRNYLQGQIDLGDVELCLDEPWSLNQVKAKPIPPRPVLTNVRPMNPPPIADKFSGLLDDSGMFGTPATSTPMIGELTSPAPRSVKKTIAVYESADSLDAFYASLKTDILYAQTQVIPHYEGPIKPRLLFLLPAKPAGETCENFLQSLVGEMLVRLFANLGIDSTAIGVTYFFKGAPRAISPLLVTSLKKMLSKELSFIQPELMVTFGEPLFQNIFGKSKPFNELAGTDLNFMGVKTVSLVDPYAMEQDKQLKWLTWKVHIPRSTYFTKPQS